MTFMITIYHTHKVADWCFPDRAKINVNKHKQGNQECCHNMKKIGKVKSAGPDNTGGDDFRVHQCPSTDHNDGEQDIHGANVGNLLKGIEFSFRV